jgi:hypothetical protein
MRYGCFCDVFIVHVRRMIAAFRANVKATMEKHKGRDTFVDECRHEND